MGFLIFGDVPAISTIASGLVTACATSWIGGRESKRAP